MIEIGTRVSIASEPDPLEVVRLIGSGGEGDVYELANDGRTYRAALKWYFQPQATDQRRHQISALIERGAPNDRFLWPEGLIVDEQLGRFGYVMALRPDDYIGLAALLRGQVPRLEPSVIRFAFELAHAFMALHTRGLCYRDINFGNAFMHPTSGRALICDNDNVGIDGLNEAMVLGSKKFMAPEIVRRQAMPSKFTDRYSLAVMLFYLLVVHHPLEGRRTEIGLADHEADLSNYGTDPLFCFDPDDDTNRPNPDFHAHVERLWMTYPSRIRQLFTRSFTVGIGVPGRRVVDSEWCDALADLRAGYFPCTNCSRPCYLQAGLPPDACRSCGKDPGPVAALRIGEQHVVIRDGAQVTSHHLNHDFDFDTVIGTVQTHPTNPSLLGLRNDTDQPLSWIPPPERQHSTPQPLPPKRRASLLEGSSLLLTSGQSAEAAQVVQLAR